MDEAITDRSSVMADLVVPIEISTYRRRPLERASEIYRRITAGLVLGDVVAGEVAILLTWLLRRSGPVPAHVTLLLAALVPVTMAAVFGSYRLYRIPWISPNEEFRRVIGAVSVSVVILAVTASLVSGLFFARAVRAPLSVGWLGTHWVVLMVLVMLERKAWHLVLHGLRRSGALAMRTIVIGANDEGVELARGLDVPATGFEVIGMIPVNGERPTDRGPIDAPVLGSLDELADLVRQHRVECAFIASSAMRPSSVSGLLTTMRRLSVDVRVSANLPEILASRLSVQTVGSTLALSVQTASLSGWQAFVKRAFDIVIASLALVVTAPISLAASVAIWVSSGSPVLYRQQRVGRHGRAFTMLKFRTMVVGADRMVADLERENGDRGPLFKLDRDPRLTPVGRILRSFSIDELPQLINVLRGDMSLVGPRPMPARFGNDRYERWQLERLEVLPGITGLWQVSGRSELSFEECVRLDLFYIENWSVTYDLFILLKTIPAVLRGRGAY